MTRSTGTGKATKAAQMRKLLQARSGATISRLQEATGWQPHSVRAALSRLRKAGYTIERRAPKAPSGAARYRITAAPGETA